ncbi:MAG: glycosyltransferase family 4 protein [Nanoarchaeota archaeon]
MKILELCHFSAGICGVWQRVKQESERLTKNNQVLVISSNVTKGTWEIAPPEENLYGFKIIRKPFKKFGGESFMSWDFEKEALDFKPDVIIAHSYRHLHTTHALKLAKKLKKQGINCKVFLVTHAPFGRKRSLIQSIFVSLYDTFKGKSTLNKFNKVIAITKWEIPYLEKLGLEKNKITYIPNGIPEEFFTIKNSSKSTKSKEENKILFLGRVSPIKNLEVMLKALSSINDKNLFLEIVGPVEEEYKLKLEALIKQLGLEKKVLFSKPIYDVKEKINKIDSCRFFILPSISEGMPQSLVEAMSRGKIVIASDNLASRDLVEDKKNGFIFNNNDKKDLSEKINLLLISDEKVLNKVRLEASNSVKKFNWKIIISQINELFR